MNFGRAMLVLMVGCVAAQPTQETDAGTSPSDAAVDAGLLDTGALDAGAPALTWHADVRPLFDRHCIGCHQAGEIGPFVLDNYEAVATMRSAVLASVQSGSMPPWQAAKGCNDYADDYSLSDAQKATIIDWVEQGALEGDEADYVAPPTSNTTLSRTDVTLTMPVDYSPQGRPDDYRCFLLDWPEDRERYVTGFAVDPGNRQAVHHVIAFLINPELVERFRAKDAAEEGPGYTCFGGPGELADGVDWLGSWAPGGKPSDLPEGTGIRVRPGSVIAMQVHYNAQGSEPVVDRTSMRFRLDDHVERPSLWMPWTNPFWVRNQVPMSIPAGARGVQHQFEYDPTTVGRPFGDQAFDVHLAGVHMHLLGRTIRVSIQRANGDETCLEDVQDWDFNWQGGVRLKEPVRFEPGDRLRVECSWDNVPERQPVIDGVRQEPRDVIWGDGTGDEMCLGLLYVSPAD